MDSILTSIKKLLGITEEYTHFDTDITMNINAVLAILTQMGVGPSSGFAILDKTSTWEDFVGTDYNFSLLQSYVHLKVKLMFDPPATGPLTQSIERLVSEFEFRLFVNSDPVLPVLASLEEGDSNG